LHRTVLPPGLDVAGRVKGLAVVPVNTAGVVSRRVNCTPCARASVGSTCVAEAAASVPPPGTAGRSEINSAAPRPARASHAGSGGAATRAARGWASRDRFASESGLALRCVRDPPARRRGATCHKMQNPRSGVVGPPARECQRLFETRFLSQQRSNQDRHYPLKLAYFVLLPILCLRVLSELATLDREL